MLAEHLVANVIWIKRGWSVKRFAGLSVGAIPAELFTPQESACFGNLGGSVSVLALGLVFGYVLPERRAVAIKPPLKPLSGEGHPLVLVLLTRTGGSKKNALSQHFLFDPVADAVVVSGVG